MAPLCGSLISSALTGSSKLLADIFRESNTLVYTSFGYNSMYGQRHWKCYTDAEKLCSAFIRDVRLFVPLAELSSGLMKSFLCVLPS